MSKDEKPVAGLFSRLIHTGLVLLLLTLVGVRVYAHFMGPKSSGIVEDDGAADTNLTALLRRGARAFNREDWKAAADAYRKASVLDDTNPTTWVRLGYALHVDGQIDESIVVHEKVCEFSRTRSWGLYHLACCYSIKEDRQRALDYLEEAVQAGYRSRNRPISEDSDFQFLVGDTEFARLTELAKPLEDREAYRRVDFLIGHWDIFDRNAKKIGTQMIERDDEQLVLTGRIELRDEPGATCMFFYDPQERAWSNVTVDYDGNVQKCRGGISRGKLILRGEVVTAEGLVKSLRVTYSPLSNGTIEQFVEHSENGRNWSTEVACTLTPRTALTSE